MKLNVYVGWDSREQIAFKACVDSIYDNTCDPDVNVIPLIAEELKAIYNRSKYFPKEKAATEFAFTRFLVPHLNGFEGLAVFMDCDMIITKDISELFSFAFKDKGNAVHVVKHDYTPKFQEKMDNQPQIVYPRKNWSSVMLFNCKHRACHGLTPDVVSRRDGAYLHRLQWCLDGQVGSLPLEWNWLEGEYEKPDEVPANIHYTNGGVWFRKVCKTRNVNYWEEYMSYAKKYMTDEEIDFVVDNQT